MYYHSITILLPPLPAYYDVMKQIYTRIQCLFPSCVDLETKLCTNRRQLWLDKFQMIKSAYCIFETTQFLAIIIIHIWSTPTLIFISIFPGQHCISLKQFTASCSLVGILLSHPSFQHNYFTLSSAFCCHRRDLGDSS